jgi:hypothetical protein
VLADDLRLMEVWDLRVPVTPPRSQVFPLAPIGVGSPGVESVTGYCVRLANEHSISTAQMVVALLAPNMATARVKNQRRNALGSMLAIAGSSFNGLDLWAEESVDALQCLTGLDTPKGLSFVPWRGALSHWALLRKGRYWCPCCYEDDLRGSAVPYERLMWSVAAVQFCPTHHARLEWKCRACGRTQAPLANNSRAGYCAYCGGWLGLVEADPSLRFCDENDYELRVSERIGHLVAAGCDASMRADRGTMSRGVSRLIRLKCNGVLARLARDARISATTLSVWIRGKSAIAMASLLNLCELCDVMPADVLRGVEFEVGHGRMVARSPGRSPTSSRRRGSADRVAVGQLIEELLLRRPVPAPSLADVARGFGYNPQLLRYWCEEQCKTIAGRGARWRLVKAAIDQDYAAREVWETVLDLCMETIEPTRNMIQSRVAGGAIDWTLRMDAVREFAIDEARQRDLRQNHSVA